MVLQPYPDITSKLGKPLWWDEAGCPRYAPFRPDLCSNIYATEAALVEIACQLCGARFLVAFTSNGIQAYENGGRTLADEIRSGVLGYGDPPMHKECCAGYTVTSDAVRVMEYWHQERLTWLRQPELEKLFKVENEKMSKRTLRRTCRR